MKKFIVAYGGRVFWSCRNEIEVICKDEDIKTVAYAIYKGQMGIGNKGFCVVTDTTTGDSEILADCM